MAIKVTLKRSPIGQRPAVRKSLKALKLGKINSNSSYEETESIMGIIATVRHLVEVEKI